MFGYTQPADMQGTFTPVLTTNASRVEAVNVTQTQTSDVGIEGGGPVLQNRLFYFAATNPQWDRTRFQAPIRFRFVMRQALTPTGSAAFWRIRPRARGKCRRRTGSTRHFSATRGMGRRVRSDRRRSFGPTLRDTASSISSAAATGQSA